MMPHPLDNADLLRRFLVDQVTDEERHAIEERMFQDSAFFESITALEEEMFIDAARGRLDARWVEPLAKAIDASPDRRRHYENARQLIAALPARRAQPWYRWAAAAVLVLATAGAVRWALRPGESGATAPATPTVAASFVLAPGPTRSPDDAGNRIDLTRISGDVRFVAVLNQPASSVVTARARSVGGPYLDLAEVTTVRGLSDGVEVTWQVPAALWAAGDYLIEYSAASDAGMPAIIGTRFVRIER